MKGKRTRITDHGVKISQGRVLSVSNNNLSPFEQLALVTYPKLYYVDNNGILQKRKNADALIQKGIGPNKRARTQQPGAKPKLGSQEVPRTPQQRKELHKKRMESPDIARTKLDKIRAEMRERYLLKKQAGMLARESEETSHSVDQSRGEGTPKEDSTSEGTTDLQTSSGQGTERDDENRIQRPDSD